jgi:hypothetical protein
MAISFLGMGSGTGRIPTQYYRILLSESMTG